MHFEGQTWEFSSEIKIEACTNPRIRFREVHIAYHPRIGFSHFHTWQKAIAVGVLDIRFLVGPTFRLSPGAPASGLCTSTTGGGTNARPARV